MPELSRAGAIAREENTLGDSKYETGRARAR
jgi:hypothetical protein